MPTKEIVGVMADAKEFSTQGLASAVDGPCKPPPPPCTAPPCRGCKPPCRPGLGELVSPATGLSKPK